MFVWDLTWHLSPGVLIQLLKKSFHLTYTYSSPPEQSQHVVLPPSLRQRVQLLDLQLACVPPLKILSLLVLSFLLRTL